MKIDSHRITRRTFLGSTTALAASLANRHAFAAEAPDESKDYLLHFTQPATKWPDALPVGNGRLGAMVFGNPSLERIQLNEESIWAGQPGLDRNNPRAAEAVPKIRELLFAGKVAEAEQLASTDMLSIPQRMPCYQTLGDLHLDFSPMGLTPDTKVEDYRLELNLDTAIATTHFTHQGVRYTREVFSSQPDQVIVIRLTASEPGKLSFHAKLDRPHNFHSELLPKSRISLWGQALPVNDNPGLPIKEPQTGVRFYAEMWCLNQGGSYPEATSDLPFSPIHLNNATSVTLLIDCATSYRYPSPSSEPERFVEGDPAAMKAGVNKNLTAASHRTYAELRARHISAHQRLFRRAEISLGPDPNAHIPTDQRVQHIKDGGEDIHLLPIYFQYGRYMLISSSRPFTLPSNLQGIWNESVDPPWGSKYTININLEMNYWLAHRANLADCALPLQDLVATMSGPGKITAARYYKARGIVAHHNTDIWGDTGPIDGLGGGIWAMGAAWLSLHLWEQFDYSGDLDSLRHYAYPVLRQNVLFLLDYLVSAPEGTPYASLLVTGPSCSPENKYKLPNGKSFNLCMGPTMDIAITRAVLTRFVESAKLLGGLDPGLVARAEAALPRLPGYKITHDGRLQEWPEDFVDQEPGHRHISHLFGLFPDDQITPAKAPELAQAARVTLDKRLAAGGGSTGWSRSWIINCMARLEDGEAAYQNVLQLFRQSTRHNLFDVCGLKENSPFQIDGNLGGPTGLIEMLLQSHGGVIRILPALPSAWPNGTFRGLKARGGLEVDLAWQKGKATTAHLRTSKTAQITIASPTGQTLKSIVNSNKPIDITTNHDATNTITTSPNQTYTLHFS